MKRQYGWGRDNLLVAIVWEGVITLTPRADPFWFRFVGSHDNARQRTREEYLYTPDAKDCFQHYPQ